MRNVSSALCRCTVATAYQNHTAHHVQARAEGGEKDDLVNGKEVLAPTLCVRHLSEAIRGISSITNLLPESEVIGALESALVVGDPVLAVEPAGRSQNTAPNAIAPVSTYPAIFKERGVVALGFAGAIDGLVMLSGVVTWESPNRTIGRHDAPSP
jgi:hypothetical protein